MRRSSVPCGRSVFGVTYPSYFYTLLHRRVEAQGIEHCSGRSRFSAFSRKCPLERTEHRATCAEAEHTSADTENRDLTPAGVSYADATPETRRPYADAPCGRRCTAASRGRAGQAAHPRDHWLRHPGSENLRIAAS